MRNRFASAIFAIVLLPLSAVSISASSGLPAGFVEVNADHVPWKARPAMPGVEIAVLLGEPREAGPLVVRVRFPANGQVQPHTHPDARTYTILAGEWKLGFGEKFDPAALRSYKAGSLYRLPAKVPHFQAAGPEGAVVQIESIGPTSTDFIEADR